MVDFKNIIMQCKGIKKQLSSSLEEKEKEVDSLTKRLSNVEKAQVFLQKVANDTQSQLRFKIEDIVNLSLQTCFPDEYEFRLDFNIQRGKTECSFVFISKKTNREIDIMNSVGGGLIDIVCFSLRIACYILEKNIDNVIILDEPMKFVSKDLRENVCKVIRILSDKLGLQFIIITHISEFIDVADKVFTVKKDENGISNIFE